MSDSNIEYTPYQVAKGVLRIPRNFTGGSDNTFSRKSDFLNVGDAIPEGMIPETNLRQLLANGTVTRISSRQGVAAAQNEASKDVSPWNVNPASLGDKSLEDLRVMINEIDATFPLEALNEDGARRLLTKDFDPSMIESSPAVIATDAVSRLTTEGARSGDSTELSRIAAANLQELQERAGTPEAEGDQEALSAPLGDGESALLNFVDDNSEALKAALTDSQETSAAAAEESLEKGEDPVLDPKQVHEAEDAPVSSLRDQMKGNADQSGK